MSQLDFDESEEEEHQMNQQQTSSSASASNLNLAKKAKRDYQILTATQLQAELDELAGESSSVLGISAAQCKLLLSRFRWDKALLLERYFEAADLERFLLNAGIMAELGVQPKRPKRGLCQICLDKGSLLGLPCAHLFCTDCWAQYLQQAILNEGRVNVQCPAERCTVAVDEDFARARLKQSGEKALEHLARIQLNSFVEGNPLLKWCPAPNCGRAAKAQLSEARRIKCTCGNTFCFQCGQPWHAPVGCSLLKIWLKQCNDDSETYNWINAFTKDCPKCKTAIEKNGGCNHMTCRAVACKFEFCWVCMGDWGSHNGNYSCNRFTEESKTKEKQMDESRSALKRYLHYYDRFRNHENSLKFENKLYDQVRTMIEYFQNAGFSYVDTMFMRAAVDALCECRRTLMYTYAFAFYLRQDDAQTRIFEDNQQNLEASTEQLSEYLERDLEQEKDLGELKRNVQDKTRYVEARRMKMLQHCQEGAQLGQWHYNRMEVNGPRDGVVSNIC